MRSRLNVYALIALFVFVIALPSNAAESLTPAEETPVISRIADWLERLPVAVKRLLRFGARTNGDHLSPPLP